MVKIAVFGGAFDPPHVGHVLSVNSIFDSKAADEVWFVPSGQGRYDKTPVASPEQREEMLKLVIDECFPGKPVKIDDRQLSSPDDKCYSIDLMDALKKSYPRNEFFLVLGSENAAEVENWREGKRLLAEYKFLVVTRPGHELPAGAPSNMISVSGPDAVLSNASSSMVRRFLQEDRDAAALVPASVAAYIKTKALYER